MPRRRDATAALALALLALLLLLLADGPALDPAPAPVPGGAADTPAPPGGAATAPAEPATGPEPAPGADTTAPASPDDPPLVVRGRLLDAGGRPLAGRRVGLGGAPALRFLAGVIERTRFSGDVVLPAGARPMITEDGLDPGSSALGRTGPDGSFEIRIERLPAGEYELTFGGDDGIEHRIDGVALRPGTPADVGDLRAPAPGSLCGRVLDAEGSYAPGAWIGCVPADDLSAETFGTEARRLARRISPFRLRDDDPRLRRALADSRGDFSFERLRPGRYRLYATLAGSDVGGTLAPIEVSEGRLTGPVRVVLDTRGSFIEGRVVGRDGGEPVPFALVSSGDAGVRADEGGAFRIGPVWPGRVSVFAASEGRPSARAGPLEVPPGETVTGVVIEMAPAR